MVKLVSKCGVPSSGVIGCCPSYPWVSLVQMLVVAVLIVMTDVVPMFGTIEFDLEPSSSLCIFDRAPLIMILPVEIRMTGVCSGSGNSAVV